MSTKESEATLHDDIQAATRLADGVVKSDTAVPTGTVQLGMDAMVGMDRTRR